MASPIMISLIPNPNFRTCCEMNTQNPFAQPYYGNRSHGKTRVPQLVWQNIPNLMDRGVAKKLLFGCFSGGVVQ